MTELTDLILSCRNLIGDLDEVAPIFSDAQITEWINNAIADLSLSFPRQLTGELATTHDTRKYDLTSTDTDTDLPRIINVVSVEYPADQDPPQYLKPRHYTHPHFWTQDGYYCFVKRSEAYVPDEEGTEGYGSPAQLWISTNPANDETIRLEYTAEHPPMVDGEETQHLTVQPRHEHLIHLFVRWKAWSELAIGVGMDPSPVNLLSATEEVNAGRAERSYKTALKEAQQAESATGIVEFRMDHHDRIY